MLPDMSPGEKAQRLQRVVSDLTNIYPGIEKTPGVCGGGCLRGKYPDSGVVADQFPEFRPYGRTAT